MSIKKKVKKLRTYNVDWTERHSANVQAISKKDACNIVRQGEFDTANEAAEFIDESFDAVVMHIK